ncbi:hypothetical protein TH53_19770 [Pedobacter lusitanus]|uniref:Uncharacterized protein n=1 Tax=Pedobacter lusitanus TaxID=1503925 RepID=A0A0D0FT04_9SPHI|nr:hypothetical protein [Pedobacter lusitanus]KIO75579.1 hypothetical protein TH53_19770 [Pedobacter lusitanus]
MSIITYNDFKGEQNIAAISNIGIRESLQVFIDEYEPLFLESLLGDALAAEFVAGLALAPIDPKWLFLRDNTSLKKMLVCCVYYHYRQNEITLTSGTGEVKSKNENSNPVNVIDKCTKSWNNMVHMARKFTLDRSIYPDYPHRNTVWVYEMWGNYCNRSRIDNIYEFKNSLGL